MAYYDSYFEQLYVNGRRAFRARSPNKGMKPWNPINGKSSDHPVLITIVGTTFYKLHKLRERFETYFNGYLST